MTTTTIHSAPRSSQVEDGAKRMLSRAQVNAFDRDGFLLLPGLLTPADLAVAAAGTPQVLADRSERTILEASGAAVRSVYAPHQHHEVMAALARHPHLVDAARDLLAGEVYVYQSKLNVKAAHVGEVWEWHQDYIFWQREDGMPAPRVLTAAVFLDDVTDDNGPMLLMPGSQREGVLPCEGERRRDDAGPEWLSHLSANLKYTIDREVLGRLAARYGVRPATGLAGSVLLFDGHVAHASSPNLSDSGRSLMMFTYNNVDNAPAAAALTRPEFLVSRDSAPLRPLPAGGFAATRRRLVG